MAKIKINQKEKENQELLEEIEKIKQSEDHKNMLEKKEKIIVLKGESQEKIFALKQLIDFKALANFFHINEEQMNILKNHKENFHANFEKDNGKMIIDLLDEAKLNNNTIITRTYHFRQSEQFGCLSIQLFIIQNFITQPDTVIQPDSFNIVIG